MVMRRHGSLSRETSLDPELGYFSPEENYAFEKDRVMFELAKRMKKKVPPGRMDKNRRGGGGE
jgi:hypothetical protein